MTGIEPPLAHFRRASFRNTGPSQHWFPQTRLRSPRMRFESRPTEPPFLPLDEFFALDKHRPQDAAAHRRFSVDPDAARFFGWTVEQAESAPDGHYDDVIQRFAREWCDGTRFSLVIRRRSNSEAVGTVELRPVADEADVSSC